MKLVKKEKLVVLVLLIFLGLTLFVGCAETPEVIDELDEIDEVAQDEVYEWDFLFFIPLGSWITSIELENFAAAVTEETDGRLIITPRPPGELPYRPVEFVSVVGDGTAEMADGYAGIISGDIRIAELENLPFLATSLEEKVAVMEVVLPYIEEELAKYNLTLLFYYTWPPQNLWGIGNPIQSLEDFDGRQIRTSGPEASEFFAELGANPVTIDIGELVPALQRGVVDSVSTSAMTLTGVGFADALEWGYMYEMHYPNSYIIVNNDALNALPDDLRETLLRVAKEYEEIMFNSVVPFSENEEIVLVEEYGFELFQMTEEQLKQARDVTSKMWERVAEDQGGVSPQLMQEIRDILGL